MKRIRKNRKALGACLTPCHGGEGGVALVLAMFVMVAVSIVAIGLSTDVATDIGISGNLRKYTQALYLGEGGLDSAEESIGLSVDTKGADTQSSTVATANYYLGGDQYTVRLTVENPGDVLYMDGGTVELLGPDGQASVDVVELGLEWNRGAAIQMAAGYEGVGKGSGSFGTISLYGFDSGGAELAASSGGRSEMAAVYRYVSGSGGR